MFAGGFGSLLVDRWGGGLPAVTIVWSAGFVCWPPPPETGWPQQEQYKSHNNPSHQHHGEGQILVAPLLSIWTGQFLRALDVSAERLGLPEQVDESSHGILMCADALARVKASFCHFSARNDPPSDGNVEQCDK